MEWYSLLPFSSSVLGSLCVPWPWERNMLSDPAPPKQAWVLSSHLPLTRDRAFFVVLLTCALAPATASSLHRYLIGDSFCRPYPSCSRFLLLKEESSRPGSTPSPQQYFCFSTSGSTIRRLLFCPQSFLKPCVRSKEKSLHVVVKFPCVYGHQVSRLLTLGL